ncbi:hypothetical protein B0O80DRAFT_500850 [Mortierella sp. GBAus27b]|nr:hypothetical protein B0O80DRAFT_500850 [Mortierella sp. GBAus27b]
MDEPRVFSDDYYSRGLRLFPQCGVKAVYIPDIDYYWVGQNILVPYQSSYVLQVLNSLLYLRLSSLSRKEGKMAEYEQNMLLERISAMEITPSNNNANDCDCDNHNNANTCANSSTSLSTSKSSGDIIVYHTQEAFEMEVQQQSQVQCLIHGDGTNIDQDMWRLFDLWRTLHKEEENLFSAWGQERGQVRASFPKDGPRLKLMLKSGESYVQIRPDVKVFDEYEDIPEGAEAPICPLLTALPSHQYQMEQQLPCLQWNTGSSGQATGGDHAQGTSTANELPDIAHLRIQE